MFLYRVKSYLFFIRKLFWGSFGYRSVIDKPLLLTNKKHIFIGKKVYIRKGARIEPVTRYYNQLYNPRVIIEDGVVIEQNFHLACANLVRICKNVSISSYVFITDIDHNYSDINIPIYQQGLTVKETIIGEESFLGTGVKVMSGCRIGKHCIIGSNAVVTHDIPDYCVAVGIPAKVISKYDNQKKEWVKC